MSRWRIHAAAALLWMVSSAAASAAFLSAGSAGSDVEALQNTLVAAGYLARTVDGEYGSATMRAVALFQRDKGIPVTGNADDVTIAALKAAAKKGYRKGGGIVYAKGNRGDEITHVQSKLRQGGYIGWEPDGVFGDGTVKAVSALQKDKGLSVSGAVDETTLAVIENLGKDIPEAAEARERDYLYGQGDQGKDIEALQEKLKKQGYLKGGVDGVYGNDTKQAVQAMQREIGLSPTGQVDQHTLNVLNTLSAKAKKKKSFDVLTLGDRGDKVARLQNRLLLHGYDPGIADGVFGNTTAEAVKKLQKQNHLPLTGKADKKVWDALEGAPYFMGKYKRVFHMRSTAYTPYDGGGSGRTAWGAYAGKGHAAVDPDVIPLGSIVFIEEYGYAVCDDIGGAIRGNIIDVGVDTMNQAYSWGIKDDVKVYLIR